MRRKLKRISKLVALEFPRLGRLFGIENDGKLIRVDYGYQPRVRDANTPAYRKMHALLDARRDVYEKTLADIQSLTPLLANISNTASSDPEQPYWQNTWLPVLDGMTLYSMVALRKPSRYVEIGSGNSTKFARRAIRDLSLATKIISIDPTPRAEIDNICDESIRARCEDVPNAFFEQLRPDDLLFVDNSHRSFQNSDVTVFFTEILPALPRGMIVGLHDVFLPQDYPERWTQRFYNEQYLLAAYLFGGGDGAEILLPNFFISLDPALKEIAASLIKDCKISDPGHPGTIFWMQR